MTSTNDKVEQQEHEDELLRWPTTRHKGEIFATTKTTKKRTGDDDKRVVVAAASWPSSSSSTTTTTSSSSYIHSRAVTEVATEKVANTQEEGIGTSSSSISSTATAAAEPEPASVAIAKDTSKFTLTACPLNPCPDSSSKCIAYNDIVYCSCPYIDDEHIGGYTLGLNEHDPARCSMDIILKEDLGWFIGVNTSLDICLENPCPSTSLDCIPFGISYCRCPNNHGKYTRYDQHCPGSGIPGLYEDELNSRKWIAILIPIIFCVVIGFWCCCGKSKRRIKRVSIDKRRQVLATDDCM